MTPTISVSEICAMTGATAPQSNQQFTGIETLHQATSSHVSFCAHARYRQALSQTQAGACFMRASDQPYAPAHTLALITPHPHEAFALLAAHFFPPEPLIPTIHDQALIHPTALLGEGCCIEANVIIGENVRIGSGTFVGAGTVIDKGVIIGQDCWIGPQVTLSHTVIGERVYIKAGARIGQRGFGFIPVQGQLLTIPHRGRVLVGDDVEIGANTTIDRGSYSDTVIGARTRIDNLVQIAHNVNIGQDVIIAAQCGIAGSCTVGDKSMMGGQVGIVGHISIAPQTQIAAKSGIAKSTNPGDIVAGIPAIPIQQWRRYVIQVQRSTSEKTS